MISLNSPDDGQPVRPPWQLNFLLVDDDNICQFIHRRVLEMSGCCKSAHSALNGKAALEILDRAASGAMTIPDVILLDLDMPLMNGLAFLEAFREFDNALKQRIAIVLLTSSVSGKDWDSARALGVKYCLPKPLTHEKLHSAIEAILNTRPPACMWPADQDSE